MPDTSSNCEEEKTKRVSLDFSLEAYEELEKLRNKRPSCLTDSGVIRDALRLLMWATDAMEDGFSIGAFKETKHQIVLREVKM